MLGQVKTEFNKFGEVVDATRKSLEAAAKKFEQVDVRTRAIKRKLSGVHELPNAGDENDEGDSQLALPQMTIPGKPAPEGHA